VQNSLDKTALYLHSSVSDCQTGNYPKLIIWSWKVQVSKPT